MRTVAGRLESRYSYAPAVYNSFPWPEMNQRQKESVEQYARAVLDPRNLYPDKSLDDLYDPDSMPPALRKAHDILDRAVDRLYRRSGFRFERERVEFLFELFEKGTAPLDITLTTAGEKQRQRRAN